MPSKTFRDFYMVDLDPPQRKAYAELAKSSVGFLTQLAYCKKRVGLGFADMLVALSGHRVTLDGIQLTTDGARQRLIRESAAASQPYVEPAPTNRRSGKDRRDHERAKAA